MMTVKEVSKLTGVSVRTLHYYDEIGLFVPAMTTDAGYRLYDNSDLERLQQILLFKELGFSLKDIKGIMDRPDFDRKKALSDQIVLLTLKKEYFENLISFAKQIESTGVCSMNFTAFDRQKIDDYKSKAKKIWGGTEAYREYENKTADYSDEKQKLLAREMMSIFTEFGSKREKSPADADAQELVGKLQKYISEHFYTCTNEILAGLGQMYAAGGEMTENIDSTGGKGTAEFVSAAIAEYCNLNE